MEENKIFNQEFEDGFIGSNRYKLDSKLRVQFPQEFVDLLDTKYADENRTVVVTLSLNKAIGIYPLSEYRRFTRSLKGVPALNRNMRNLQTLIEGFAYKTTLDSQKRIRLSEELCKSTQLCKEVYVKGFDDHVEVWQKEKWDSFAMSMIPNMDTIADEASKSMEYNLRGGF